MSTPETFEIQRQRPDGARSDRGPLSIRGEVHHSAAEALGTVVICHGFKGFAHWGFFQYLARELAQAGLRAITFDFSGSGVGPDRESYTQLDEFRTNTFSQELEDVESVVSEALSRGWITGGRYGLFGHSRGGGVAILHAARDSRVGALVTWSAVSHVRRWPRKDVEEWRARGYVDVINTRTGQTMPLSTDLLDDIEANERTTLDIAAAAGRIRAPWLIIHGGADETVAPDEARRLHELAPDASALLIVEGANHGFGATHPLSDPPAGLQSVTRDTVEFFAGHLAGAAV